MKIVKKDLAENDHLFCINCFMVNDRVCECKFIKENEKKGDEDLFILFSVCMRIAVVIIK